MLWSLQQSHEMDYQNQTHLIFNVGCLNRQINKYKVNLIVPSADMQPGKYKMNKNPGLLGPFPNTFNHFIGSNLLVPFHHFTILTTLSRDIQCEIVYWGMVSQSSDNNNVS